MFKLKLAGVDAALTLAASSASAALVGTYYNTGGVQGGGSPMTNSMTSVQTFLSGNPTADATFTSTGLNYGGPSPYLFTDVNSFLGVDATSLTPMSAGADSLLGSVIVFTGQLVLKDGLNTFDIFSDDGFSLKINSIEIGRFERLRAPTNSGTDNMQANSIGVNTIDFEPTYFEGSNTQAAQIAKLNGEITGAEVPLPGGMGLILGGIGAFGALRMRKKKAAA